MWTRRSLLAAGGVAAGVCQAARGQDQSSGLPPIRAITRGPGFHWFGYYDKLQFDETDRYVLGMRSAWENRSPSGEDKIELGSIDLAGGDRWTKIGESKAWCWQQGCMLQWLPGRSNEVIWNDREGDKFVSRILDVKTKKMRTIAAPVYAVSPDSKWAVAPDFRRLHDLRPGYGYAGIDDPNREVAIPEDAGIWRTNLESGKTEMLFSFGDIAKIPSPHAPMKDARHWFNHLLYSPDGSRFIFLHRWRGPEHKQGFATRMITADANGKDLYVVDPYGKTSHFIWRDNQHILAWAFHPTSGEKFYLYRDKTDRVEVVGPDVMVVNGHCTYVPRNGKPDDRWILNDTYPDKDRLQHPYLFDTKTNRRVPLAHLLSPPEYTGEWRVDNHPRFSRGGKLVTVDSPHGGNGRQIWLIDIGKIVA